VDGVNKRPDSMEWAFEHPNRKKQVGFGAGLGVKTGTSI
jgi:hypothetical protein